MIKSLKVKILSILIGLLVVTVSFNLIYSYRLFINDKKSYIFEAGLRQSENLNDQVYFKIKEHTTFLRLPESIYLDPAISQKVLGKNDEILAIGQVDSEGRIVSVTKNAYLIQRQKSSGKASFEINEGDAFLSPSIFKVNQLHPAILKNSAKGYAYFLKSNAGNYNFFFTTADSIDNIFKSNSLFSNLYLNLGDPKPQHPLLTSAVKNLPGEKGTFEFRTEDDQELLVSFVKSSGGSHAVVSYMPKERAFQITSDLVIQAILFGLFLLSILITIGVYFSSSITTPILELTKLAGEFSRGEFGQKFIPKTNDEIAVLGNTFNNMNLEIESLLEVKEEMIKSKALIIKDLEEAKAKLEDYSQNLEKKVKQRTIEIKKANVFMGAMVNSLDQGLMVFDKSLRCQSIYTTVCEKLFSLVPNGKPLYEIIGLRNPKDIESVKKWANLIFTAVAPFEHMAPLGPKSVVTGTNYYDEDFKHIALKYHPMKDQNNNIENIVVLASDVTKEIRSIEISKEKEAYAKMIVKILNNKAQFQLFVNYVKVIFENLSSCYNEQEETLNCEQALQLFHTLNGGFGLYNLFELQDLARKNEFSVTDFKNQKDEINKFPAIIAYFESRFIMNIKHIDELLQTHFLDGNITREIEWSKIYSLKQLIDKSGSAELIEEYYDNLVTEPVIKYIEQYSDQLMTLAKESSKSIKPVIIRNGELKIDPAPFMEFFSVLIHVFKNCIEHGIESVSAREKAGKPPEGQIEVECAKIIEDGTSYLTISIQDDGGGIDPKRIKAKLEQLYPNEDFSNIPPEEFINKIFDPYFTTNDKLRTHSGRGVGMSAVKDAVDNLNGTIRIESKLGRRTKFVFSLPLS
ncbi:MAG: ATP-binding protein [Bacteriovorax sp.]|jgi:two-component system chemotaxis sensor kinase CheA